MGRICLCAWVVCVLHASAFHLDRPSFGRGDEDSRSDSVEYLKVVFVSVYFFDTGLYFPKVSLVAFYWWLIPQGFRRLRIAVYVTTAIVVACFAASILCDTLLAPHISDNWSIENQLNSTWNTYSNLVVNWTLNFGTDLLLFGLPFFIFNCLKLRRRQKVGLVGVFSLGVITMTISLARFIVYNMDYDIADADGNLWCTAEMCTAIIVVSLPSLKSLLVKPTTPNTSNRSNSGYLQANSNKTIGSKDINNGNGYSSHVEGGTMDDEMELTFLDRKVSPTPTGTTDETRVQDGKDNVIVTTHFTVTRDAF